MVPAGGSQYWHDTMGGEAILPDHIMGSKKYVGRVINQVIVGLGAGGTL